MLSDCLSILIFRNNIEQFLLSDDMLAYGFPLAGNGKPINSRMLKGHMQAIYGNAYELSFPAFPGLSGPPVFRDWGKRSFAIGIVAGRTHAPLKKADIER